MKPLPATCLLVSAYPTPPIEATEPCSKIPCDRCRAEVWIGTACKRLFMENRVYPICIPCYAKEAR